jgi:hypothetical protein
MRYLAAAIILCACCAASGCATALLSIAQLIEPAASQVQSTTSEFAAAGENYSTQGPTDPAPGAADANRDSAALVEARPSSEAPQASEAQPSPVEPDATPAADTQPAEPPGEYALAVDQQSTERQGEEIPVPAPAVAGPFKPREDESDIDRFTRQLAEVPLDIRPTQGVMPPDLAAREFADDVAAADPRDTHELPGIYCSYTPWTICFRPLYFEEVALERYGQKCRFIQPAVSGAHFFSSVALLPYKMRVRPPRSCVCSNGFSRPCDCPPPGYGECVWRWDAALVEAAAVTGFVFILP